MFKRIKKFLFTNTSDKQTIIKNTLWLTGSEILVRIFRFILIIYVARILGAEGWGLFSYAISLIGMSLVFSDAGISFLLLKEYSNNKKRLLKTILTVKGLLIGVSSIIAIIAGFFFATLPIASIVIPVATTLIFDSARDFLGTLLRAKEKMEVEAFIKIATNIVLVTSSIVLIVTYKSPLSLAIGYTIGSSFGFLLSIIKTFPLLKEIKKNITQEENKTLYIREVFFIVGPITISSLATTIMLNIDTIMLGIWKTSQDIGFYASAQRIFQTIMTLPNLFAIATLPKLSLYFYEQKDTFKNMISKAMNVLFLISIPLAVGGALIAKPLMIFLFGQEYSISGFVFAPLIIGIIFAFPSSLLNSIAVITSKQKYIAINTIIALIISVLLNIYLIPRHGIIGAAVGTTATQALLFILNSLMLRSNFKIDLKKLSVILFSTIIMSLFLFYFNHTHVLLTVIIGIASFFITLLIIDKKYLTSIWKI